MASGLYFIVLLCLTSGLWTGANAQAQEQLDEDCCDRCPPGWTQFGSHCYMFHFSAKDWGDAEVACLAVGGNLASIHNKEQETFIKQLINRSTGSDVQTWIGGQDATKEGVWLFSDGSKFDFKIWGPGQPDNAGGAENCIVINFSGIANDLSCHEKKSFVCGKQL